jgi:hypothetical protein
MVSILLWQEGKQMTRLSILYSIECGSASERHGIKTPDKRGRRKTFGQQR